MVHDLHDIDELGEQSAQILGDEKLQLFCRETAEGLRQPVKHRWVVPSLCGKKLDDGQCSR